MGGTGSESIRQDMPEELPERLEAGTVNVPGIAGLGAGLAYLKKAGTQNIGKREQAAAKRCAQGLQEQGFRVFFGPHQAGTVSFVPETDCENAAQMLAGQGIAVRAGLHCAPLAHESAGTVKTGTVRVSFGHQANRKEVDALLRGSAKLNVREF